MKENTHMRKRLGKSTLILTVGMTLAFAGQVSAQEVVFDPANFAVNNVTAGASVANAATNAVSTAVLIDTKLHMKNTDQTNKEISNYTLSIDKSTSHIDTSTSNIDASTSEIKISADSIDKSTTKIDETTNNILNLDIKNSTVNEYYTWITNNDYGSGDQDIIPIPGRAGNLMVSLDHGSIDERVGNFREATYYQGDSDAGRINAGADIVGSQAQKLANDALVNLLGEQRSRIQGEAGAIQQQAIRATKKPDNGHAEQLQNAAALAGMQANQLVQMRALMIASQNQQAAAAQAASDRQAREIASAQSLRRSFAPARSGDEQPSHLVSASW